MLGAIVAGLVLLLAVFLLMKLNRSEKIKLEYNHDGPISHLVAQMQSLTKSFCPKTCLLDGYTQTVFAMRYRKRSPITETCTRELFTFSDGGTSALDYFIPTNCDDNAPFVVIAHTLGGGTREPCVNNFAASCVRRGWRVVVANGRGCSGAPITSARLPAAPDFDDLEAIIAHIKEKYHPKFTFLTGFSLGAMQSTELAVNRGYMIDGCAVVSHTYDPWRGSLMLEKFPQSKLFTPIIVRQLRRAIQKNKFVDRPDCLAVTTMRQFDEIFTSRNLGYSGAEEYYKAGRIYDRLEKVGVPMLILGADNDPFTSPECLPIEAARRSRNVVFAHTREGGHVGFITRDGQASLIDEIVPEWFEVIMKSAE